MKRESMTRPEISRMSILRRRDSSVGLLLSGARLTAGDDVAAAVAVAAAAVEGRGVDGHIAGTEESRSNRGTSRDDTEEFARRRTAASWSSATMPALLSAESA